MYLYFKNAFNYWRLRGVPYAEPSFPLGNIQGLGTKYSQAIVSKRLYDQFRGKAKFCGIYILAGPVALILDLELVKNILVKDFSNFGDKSLYANETIEPLIGNLFFLDGEKWRKLRTKLTPTFTSGKMKFMFPKVVEVGKRFENYLVDTIDRNSDIDMKDLLARFTTDVIGTSAFGIECNSLNDPEAEFKKMGEKAFVLKYPAPIAMAIHGMKNVSRKLRVTIFPSDVSEFFLKVVRETVEYREKNNISRNDFMDILLKLKNNSNVENSVTFNEMAAQAFLFFLAGFETSSTTLMYCLYELALNPDIQAKARQVVQDAYRKHGQLTYEMMMDMPYIDHLLHETLRKYPPVSLLNRITKNDYQVPGTNHVIPGGKMVIIPIYAIHHDKEYYPEPDKFNPDRFASEESQKRHPMAWLPFSEGPRNCIGLRFGMMQSRIGLAILLNKFEFSPSSKTSHPLEFVPNSFILTPKGGVHLSVSKIR